MEMNRDERYLDDLLCLISLCLFHVTFHRHDISSQLSALQGLVAVDATLEDCHHF